MDHRCKSCFSVGIRVIPYLFILHMQIGPEPLPYTMTEDTEDVEHFIPRSEPAPLSPALMIGGKVRIFLVLFYTHTLT